MLIYNCDGCGKTEHLSAAASPESAVLGIRATVILIRRDGDPDVQIVSHTCRSCGSEIARKADASNWPKVAEERPSRG